MLKWATIDISSGGYCFDKFIKKHIWTFDSNTTFILFLLC